MKYHLKIHALPAGVLIAVSLFRPSVGRKNSFSAPPDGRSGSGGVEICKEFEQQDMKYDSTGMFHWCPPRTIEECVLVGWREIA